MNRPFHVAGMVWLAGVLLAGLGLPPVLGALGGALLLAALLLKRGRPPLWQYAGAAALCACMLSLVLFDGLLLAPAAPYAGTTQSLRALVIGTQRYPGYTVLVLETEREGAPRGLGGVRVRMSVPAGLEVSTGDVVHYTGRLERPDGDERELYARGVLLRGRLAGELTVEGRRGGPGPSLAALRERVRANLRRRLPGVEGEVAAAMVTGDSAPLSPELREDYARAGLGHLLAVSGLHLAVLTGLLDAVLRALGLSGRERGALEILAVLAFMAFTGFSYSVVRAGVMVVLCRSALLLGRDADTLNSLGFALVLILLQNPYAAHSVSLQLSYLATLGLAAFSEPAAGWMSGRLFGVSAYTLRETRPWAGALLSALAVTLGAGLATAPVLALSFGQLSLVAPLANLLAALPMGVALGGGMLCGLLGFFPPLRLLYSFCGLAAGLAVKWLNGLAAFFSGLPFAALSARDGYLTAWMAAALLTGVLLWICRAREPLRRYAACLLTVPLLAGALAHAVCWRDVLLVSVPENGGAVALAFGEQGAVIGAPETVYEARRLGTFLEENGVERIGLLVLPRGLDAYGDPVALLRQAFPVEEVAALDAGRGFEAVLFGRAAVRARGERARRVTIEAGGLRLVKEFEQAPVRADLLVNARNELILAPGLDIRADARYFGSTVIALRALPAGEGKDE